MRLARALRSQRLPAILILAATLVMGACAPATGSPSAAPTVPVGAAQGVSPSQGGSPGTAPTSSTNAVAAPAIPAQPTHITAAYSEIFLGALPVWMAADGGYFQKHGLDVDLQYIASANALASLLAGQTQITSGGGSEAISAIANGADLVAIATTIPTYPYVLEVNKDIQTVDGLRGKRIGVSSPGSSSDIATRVMLKRLGLDPDTDVTIIAVGSAQNRTAAMQNGAIDAGLDQPPGSLLDESVGFHPLVDMSALGLPTPNNTTIVTRQWLDANRDVVQRYVDAVTEAVAAAHKDSALSKQIMGKYLQDDKDADLQAAYDFYLKLGGDPPYPAVDQFNDAVTTLTAREPDVAKVDLSHLVDRSFVDSAVARGLNK